MSRGQGLQPQAPNHHHTTKIIKKDNIYIASKME